jgi:hypothetical protein
MEEPSPLYLVVCCCMVDKIGPSRENQQHHILARLKSPPIQNIPSFHVTMQKAKLNWCIWVCPEKSTWVDKAGEAQLITAAKLGQTIAMHDKLSAFVFWWMTLYCLPIQRGTISFDTKCRRRRTKTCSNCNMCYKLWQNVGSTLQAFF